MYIVRKNFEKILQAPGEDLKANTDDLIETLHASFRPIEAIVKACKKTVKAPKNALKNLTIAHIRFAIPKLIENKCRNSQNEPLKDTS